MRTLIPAAIAAALLALPASAGAVTCSYPASAYSEGAGSVGPAGGPTTGDPLGPAQWGLNQIKVPAAWRRGARGDGVTIAVVDSGVDLVHPDLASKLLAGTDFVRRVEPRSPGDPGITGPGCPGAQDENGHGTHVAGIAAAATGNGKGGGGTAPDAKILPVRFLDANGTGEGELLDDAIRWAADNGADVINLSLGPEVSLLSPVADSAADTQRAVDHAWSKGAVVVAAAGNSSLPLCDYANVQRVVCVAATDRGGTPAYYSNFPATATGNVGVRAPGGEGSPVFCEYSSDIWSAIWPGYEEGTPCTGVRGYDTSAGTSMAAPYVAGLAALLAGRGLTNAQILECLRTTSSNKGAYDDVRGYGIVDADAATASCAPASTPGFEPPPGPGGGPEPGGNPPQPPPRGGGEPGAGGSGEAQVTVTVKRTTRTQAARSGRLKATVRSDRGVSVKLRAVLTRGKSKRTAGTKTVRLGGAGTKRATVRLSKSARRALARSGKYRLVLRWRAGSRTGSARATR